MRLALLGCGYAARLHSKSLRALGKDVACYYASRNSATAEEYCQRYNGAGHFGSYQEAIESDDIDVVAVLTPPVYHLDTTLTALAAGKDVIVEKPPFLRSSDFDTIEQACRDTGRQVFIAENYYYKPLAIALRQILEDGIIGDVLFIHINAIKLQKTENWRDDAQLSGAGALFEGGIHWVNFLANLGMEVTAVRATEPGTEAPLPAAAASQTPGQLELPIDRSMLVTFEYDNGAVATLSYSWEVPSTFKGLRISRIFGRKGSMTFETNGIFLFVNGENKMFRFPGFRDIAGYKAMFRDFHKAWSTGEEPAMDLAKARRDLELIEAAYASAQAPREPITREPRKVTSP